MGILDKECETAAEMSSRKIILVDSYGAEDVLIYLHLGKSRGGRRISKFSLRGGNAAEYG